MSDIVARARELADYIQRHPKEHLHDEEAVLRELAAIVEKYPLTADGVRVYPRMPLWDPGCFQANEYRGNPGMWNSDLNECFTHLYSTREAAERAIGDGK